MIADRVTLNLGVIGATHQAESVIASLTEASRALSQIGRDGFHDAMTDAETTAHTLLKAIQAMRDANWTARCAEYDAARPAADVVRLPVKPRPVLAGVGPEAA